MTPTRKRRLLITVLILLAAATTTALFLTAFKENIMFFKSPSEIAVNDYPINRNFRVGGMVKEGTFVQAQDSLKVNFIVTDYAKDVHVEYEGILPDLFREGQGMVAIGKMNQDKVFIAEEILAKHDENYMPPEVAESLKQKPIN